MTIAIKECVVCKKPFEAVRADKKFCSDTCRQRNKRGSNEGDNELPTIQADNLAAPKVWKPLKVKKVLEAPIKVCSPDADSTAEERAAFVKCLDNYIKPV